VIHTSSTKRRLAAAGVAVALIGGLSACGRDNFRDIKGIRSQTPDRVEVMSNVDGNPNIAVLCIHGAGFASTTRDFTSIFRVPEWDRLCPPATPITGVAR
jgi:hypothetical protein